MLRKLVILGVFTGMSAAVPVLYETNPQLAAWLSSETPENAEAPVEAKLAAVQKKPDAEEPEQLTGRKMRLPVDGQGHFVAEFKFNGRRITGMIDTGATMIAINKSTARKIGLKLAADDFKHEVKTANGATKAAAAMIESVQIGKIMVENVQAVVLEDSALGEPLIGMTFLNALSKFEVSGGAMLLQQ